MIPTSVILAFNMDYGLSQGIVPCFLGGKYNFLSKKMSSFLIFICIFLQLLRNIKNMVFPPPPSLPQRPEDDKKSYLTQHHVVPSGTWARATPRGR